MITKNGFDNTITKIEFKEFKIEMFAFKKKADQNLFEIDSTLNDVNTRLKKAEQITGLVV